MLKAFLPNDYVKNIYAITPEYLKERNIKGVITDLDNTLVEWDRPLATPEIENWFKKMKDHGINIVIVSNNKEKRVYDFARPLQIPFVFKARKPLRRSFHRALSMLKLSKEEVVVIGDQLLTDILGGNRSGFHTILVVPVASSDEWVTKFNRKVERIILNKFAKKGLLKWGESSSGK
ncbi:YqeG family HAD IIIA-type phosphatase [Bacillus kwashiorkori]|uniref:YqeG family HAD IIIA-type phosphatase n=1 Tax=Bacillus kwashiorkori TaxID=1522318 RepID=UPI0007862DE4|nr:YqeG family HAD IIIA-type phosphatase [Bacillus kwashiorkori]